MQLCGRMVWGSPLKRWARWSVSGVVATGAQASEGELIIRTRIPINAGLAEKIWKFCPWREIDRGTRTTCFPGFTDRTNRLQWSGGGAAIQEADRKTTGLHKLT